jgi:hypothetical protein
MGKGVGLGSGVTDFEARLFLPSLLDNHYRLAWRRRNLSQFMQSLHTRYFLYLNRRHQPHGHPMPGRFRAVLVQGERDLLQLSRYVPI